MYDMVEVCDTEGLPCSVGDIYNYIPTLDFLSNVKN